jgi:hypothetical protein
VTKAAAKKGAMLSDDVKNALQLLPAMSEQDADMVMRAIKFHGERCKVDPSVSELAKLLEDARSAARPLRNKASQLRRKLEHDSVQNSAPRAFAASDLIVQHMDEIARLLEEEFFEIEELDGVPAGPGGIVSRVDGNPKVEFAYRMLDIWEAFTGEYGSGDEDDAANFVGGAMVVAFGSDKGSRNSARAARAIFKQQARNTGLVESRMPGFATVQAQREMALWADIRESVLTMPDPAPNSTALGEFAVFQEWLCEIRAKRLSRRQPTP